MSEPRHFPPGVGKGIFSSSLYNVQRNPSISTRPASAFALAAAAAAVSGLSTVVMMSQCPHARPALETISRHGKNLSQLRFFGPLDLSSTYRARFTWSPFACAHFFYTTIFFFTLQHPGSPFYSSTNTTSIRFLQHHTKVITNCPNRRMAHELKEASTEAQISGSFSNRRGQRSYSVSLSLSHARARLRYGSLPGGFFGVRRRLGETPGGEHGGGRRR